MENFIQSVDERTSLGKDNSTNRQEASITMKNNTALSFFFFFYSL